MVMMVKYAREMQNLLMIIVMLLQVMVMTALTKLPLPHPTRVLTEGHVIMMEIH